MDREPLTSSGEKLSSLFDRLAEHDSLYGELSADDEHFIAPPERTTDFTPLAEFDNPAGNETPIIAVDDASDTDGAMEAPQAHEPPELAAEAEDVGPVVVQAVEEVEEEAVVEIDAPLEDQPPAPAEPVSELPVEFEPDVIAAVIEFHDDLEADHAKPVTNRIIGGGFTPLPVEAPAPEATEVPAEGEPLADTELVERVSRYNFDELSRILTDRVGNELRPLDAPIELDPPIEPIRPAVAFVAVCRRRVDQYRRRDLCFESLAAAASSSFASSRFCLPTVH